MARRRPVAQWLAARITGAELSSRLTPAATRLCSTVSVETPSMASLMVQIRGQHCCVTPPVIFTVRLHWVGLLASELFLRWTIQERKLSSIVSSAPKGPILMPGWSGMPPTIFIALLMKGERRTSAPYSRWPKEALSLCYTILAAEATAHFLLPEWSAMRLGTYMVSPPRAVR